MESQASKSTETEEPKPVIIQPDDIIIKIDDLFARQFSIKEDEKNG